MKKRQRKLTLNRETIRSLERQEFTRVAGGGETFEIQTTCACSETCGTDWTCNGCGTGSGHGCGSAEACTTGQTFEIWSGCATNCG